MDAQLDLKLLSERESEQVEWKENVADTDDVAETLSAFANDWANLGGGYVVCGACEEKDDHGFPRVVLQGLTANRLKEVEGRVLMACRDRVSPPIAPLLREVATDQPDRRVLVFVMPATRTAHSFRRPEDTGKYYVRISRETREARNGLLRELLVRKGVQEEWDRRPCATATVNDLDLLALRDALQRMGVFYPEKGLEEYLSESNALSPFVPPLCHREPLSGQSRPRNFAMLLFGRNVQLHVPGAYSLFSIYPGTDRAEPHAERHELAGTITEQARRLNELLNVQSYVAFDKMSQSPNAVKFPQRALHEAMINALVHRDYENVDSTRVTVFADRIEIQSPGSLPTGVRVDDFRAGRASAKWRNQSLAWFMNRLQLAQAEGQGIPTILRSMREEGCPPPQFDVNETRVVCVLPAHPRHALAREHHALAELISIGDFERARQRIVSLLEKDPMNARTIQLFAEVQRALGSGEPVREFVTQHSTKLGALSPLTLTQLADVLLLGDAQSEERELARQLLRSASRGRMAEREISQVAVGLSRARDDRGAVDFIDAQVRKHPELNGNPVLLRIRGNSLIGLARQCTQTGKNRDLSPQTRERAWKDCRTFLSEAEQDLRRAMSYTTEPSIVEGIQRNLDSVAELRTVATPPERRRRP